MSHRADDKERRRQERLEAEQAAKQSADRKKRFGLVGAVVLVAAVAVFVVLAVAGGGDDDKSATGSGGSAAVPAEKISNLAEAARAAQCKVTKYKIEGRGHTGEKVTYKTNPPTSGDHDPTPAEDGAYADAPKTENTVHSLEHGRVNIQYKPGTSPEQIAQLEKVADEKVKGTAGYHTLVFPNQTKMEPAVAATAWGQALTCDTFNDQVFDAIRAFRRTFVDKGPEFIP
jgi:hypothetical protein